MSNNKKPNWVPKACKAWGWKLITKDRKSCFEPRARNPGCDGTTGDVKEYPYNKEVETDLCECGKQCCKGFSFYKDNIVQKFAKLYGYNVVKCYVPKGGRFVKFPSGDETLLIRSNKIVCLD